MPGIPQRQSLVAQTAAYLKAGIARGEWGQWLPGERRLCESLQVSRNTLRAALEQLAGTGIIQPEHGLGSRIVDARAAKHVAARPRTVCVLAPHPLEHLRPTHVLWIDELRALLIEHGCRLHVLHGQQFFRARPGAALSRLLRQHPHGCWILMRAAEGTQGWFNRSGEPCVIAGSALPGIDLPFVDLDHRALCRHAAGVLLAQGHRRIAFITERTRRAGDVASELGFTEGVRSSRHAGSEAIIAGHEPSVQSVCTALGRLMELARPPTAILVANPYFLLTVTSRLAQLGMRVPQDISVLSRDEDPFLSFLVPTPARYTTPHVFARKLLRPVLEILETGAATARATSIMPEFIRGESIGPPPAARH
jgi:DNA-binding LacI/PurR family transcriptional regulator